MGAAAEQRLTLDDFYREYEGRRAYLIDGVPYLMPPQNPPHAGGIDELADALRAIMPVDYRVREEKPLECGEGNDPEPDIAVVRRLDGGYTRRQPTAADALLVVEVADTSLDKDIRLKLPKYAAAGIPEAWVVDLNAGILLSYREPQGTCYQRHLSLRKGERIVPLFSSGVPLVGGSVLVGDWVAKPQ